MDGTGDGASEGGRVGAKVDGSGVGTLELVGIDDGPSVGDFVGSNVGKPVGSGEIVGTGLGPRLGDADGACVGSRVGTDEG